MYTHGMNLRILRDPGSEGGGGAAPGAAAGAQGGSAAGAGAQGGAQGGAAPEYVSKADFESFSQRMEQSLSRFSQPPSDDRRSEGDKGKPGAPKFPNLSDYNFNKPGEIERYENDKEDYYDWRREQKAEEKRKTSDAESATKRNLLSHFERMREYEKANPGANAALQKAGATQVLTPVKEAVYASRDSAAIVHYLAQNKETAMELNELAETEGMDSVRYRIGEIAATIRADAKAAKANEEAAKDRPPRQNFRGNSASANRKPSLEERFSRFHSPK